MIHAIPMREVRAYDLVYDPELVVMVDGKVQLGEWVRVTQGARPMDWTPPSNPNYEFRADGHRYTGPGNRRILVRR